MNELKHIAFIFDGNRRWARERSLPTLEGHRRGYDRVKDVADWCFDRGIEQMSGWAFSTENWKRSEEEVGYLMKLALKMLTKDVAEFNKRNVRLKVIGRRADLSKDLQKAIEAAEELTAGNTRGQFNLCFNYGGRPEILEGVKRCLREGIAPEDLTEELFTQKLWTAGIPEPDLIVRTSGEHRLSGFQAWAGVYAELFFADCYWPDFDENELEKAIEWYADRQRRFGS